MRFALVAFLAATAVLAQPTSDTLELNPRVDSAIPHAVPNEAAANTNAKRFALNMPPLKPKSRRHRATRVGSAARSQTSPLPPVPVSCNIVATYYNETTYGYLSPSWNESGVYYKFQDSQEGSLLISLAYPPDTINGPTQLTLTATNGPNAAYPYFGGVLAPDSINDNLGPPPNYGYLAGTTATEPGALATAGPNSFTAATGIDKHFQTAFWAYSPERYYLSPQWLNGPDAGNPRPTTTILYVQKMLIITGDPLAVMNRWGPAEFLRFKCVPPGWINPF